MDTRDIHQIDIDCPEYSEDIKKILKSHPYTPSTTKEYGRHIFVKDPAYDAHNNRPQFKTKYITAPPIEFNANVVATFLLLW